MWALMVMCVPLLFAFSGWLFPTNLLESILSAQTAFVALFLFLFLLLMLREKRKGGGGVWVGPGRLYSSGMHVMQSMY